jgi:predicted SAM-dependent methyltransferase
MSTEHPIKLHLACGTVYLDGYINIDVVGETDPALIEENRTTLAHYFKHPYVRRPIGGDHRGRNAVDIIADVRKLPFAAESVDEILNVNLLDHIRFQDVPALLLEWKRVLKPGGRLIIDVGDAIGNADLLQRATTREQYEWAIRLFYCHSRDAHDSHHWGYTGWYLVELLREQGFTHQWTAHDYIVHAYPSVQVCVTK